MRLSAAVLISIACLQGCDRAAAKPKVPTPADEPPRVVGTVHAPYELYQALQNAGVMNVSSYEMAKLADGHSIYRVYTLGRDAENLWPQMVKNLAPLNYYPVVVGSADDVREFQEVLKIQTVKAAPQPAISPVAWLADRRKSAADPPDGQWKEDVKLPEYFNSLYLPGWNKFRPTLYFAMVPTQDQYKAMEILRFGGFGDCPPSNVHTAIARYWGKKYKAQVFAVRPKGLEMYVEKPPETQDEALALAWEQYSYCPATLAKGDGSIEGLASYLLGNQRWEFVWD